MFARHKACCPSRITECRVERAFNTGIEFEVNNCPTTRTDEMVVMVRSQLLCEFITSEVVICDDAGYHACFFEQREVAIDARLRKVLGHRGDLANRERAHALLQRCYQTPPTACITLVDCAEHRGDVFVYSHISHVFDATARADHQVSTVIVEHEVVPDMHRRAAIGPHEVRLCEHFIG